MGRRSNHEGSVRRRDDGTYEGRLQVDGKRRSVYGATRGEVVAKLDRMRARAAVGVAPVDARMTLAEWLEHWRRTALRASDRKASTVDTYERHVRNHLVPHLGHLRLDQLRPSHVEGMLAAMRDDGAGDQLRRSVYSVLSVSLSVAVRDGLLGISPIDRVQRPQVAPRDARYFTPDEVSRLLEVAGDDRRAPILHLIAHTGLRRGEALGLRWDRLSLEDPAHLLVRATLSRITGQGLVLTEPKSKRSRRRLPLTAAMVAVLRDHQTAQKRERLQAGPAWEDSGLVFTTELGTPVDPRNVSRWASQMIGEAGLDGSLHTLRHSAATTLVAAGVPLRIVAEILGHSSTRLTDELYSHVAPDVLGEAMGHLTGALGDRS